MVEPRFTLWSCIELDNQKLFSRGMASNKSTASYIFKPFFFFKSIIKIFKILSKKEVVNELNANFICRKATRLSLNETLLSYS